jgi:surfactin synthase thioesterase subunit
MPADRLKLFSIPHAGGTASVFRPWRRSFPATIEVVPLEPPGRGTRGREAFAQSISSAAEDLLEAVENRLDGGEYVLLGHCMGALVAYEMVVLAERRGVPSPRALIVSGRNPPHLQTDWGIRVAPLPDDELLAELRSVGGVPAGLSPAMAREFLQVIRADQRMVHRYNPADPPIRIAVPVSVLAGSADQMTQQDHLVRWRDYTTATCEVRDLSGGHYFLYDQAPEVAALVSAHAGLGAA